MIRGLEHLYIPALDQEKHHRPIAQTHLLLKLHQMFEPLRNWSSLRLAFVIGARAKRTQMVNLRG